MKKLLVSDCEPCRIEPAGDGQEGDPRSHVAPGGSATARPGDLQGRRLGLRQHGVEVSGDDHPGQLVCACTDNVSQAKGEGKEAIGPRSLYLLRNADREEKGLGFALAGNFYPDFLLWLVDDASGKQWLTFVDPKGLRNLDLSHPKLGLYKEVKTRLTRGLAGGDEDAIPRFTVESRRRFRVADGGEDG